MTNACVYVMQSGGINRQLIVGRWFCDSLGYRRRDKPA